MSATRYKKTHVDILICIEMTRERNLGIKRKHPVFLTHYLFDERNNERTSIAAVMTIEGKS